MLQYAIEEGPPGIAIFAISRDRLPDALVPAHANRRVAVIGEDELRPDVEASRVGIATMEAPFGAAIDGLHARSGGRVAGLVLMSFQEATPRITGHRLDRLSQEAVVAYFNNELLCAADPALRDLLVQTALLPEVTADGARERMAVLTWARGFLPPLFALASKEGIAREWLAGAIQEWEIPPPSRNEQDWPRAPEIFVLGGFEVRRGGIRLDFGRKPPRRLISLLKAIAISGDRGLPLETACGYCWPDLEGDAAAASLTAALYRLRKLLGSPDAVRLVEGSLILPSRATWIDLHAFERLARSDDATDLEKAVFPPPRPSASRRRRALGRRDPGSRP